MVIASAREVIVSMQALLETNEQIFALEKTKMEELETTTNMVQQKLNVESSKLNPPGQVSCQEALD